METKTTHSWKLLVAGLAAGCLWLSGCGSYSANVVSVSVGDSLGGVVVVTQADTITAVVSGPTAPTGGTADLNVAFTCSFTTTTTTGTTTTTNKAKDCNTVTDGSIGTISNVQPTTEIYTAPPVLPDQTKFQGLIITITATSDFDKSKSGTVMLRLESGILVTITPAAATLALGETKQFTATLTTDNTPNDVTWGVTNTTVNTGGTPSIAGTFTLTTPTCTSTTPADNCGSIDQTGKFSAPTGTTLPTNTNVIVYAIAKKDTTRVAIANITLVTGGSITFNSLWPTVVPQGGSQADVFLNATNLTSQIGLSLKFTAADGTTATTAIDAGSNALKVFFTPSTFGATTGPVSTGARLRLTPDQLAKVGTYTVTITPGNPAEQTGTITPHTFTLVPVRPGLVASNPADISQGSTSQAISVDGGYYGPSEAPIVGINFNGSNVVNPSPVGVDPRRLTGNIKPSGLPGGLFPLSVANTTQANNVGVAYSNISILPSYANASVLSSLPHDTTGRPFPPCTPSATCVADSNGNSPFQLCAGCTPPLPISLGATTKPSAIALDPILGYAAVAEAGTNMVQLINLTTATPTLGATFSTQGTVPTGIAIDHADCTTGAAGVCSGAPQPIVAVVNYESQTLTVFTIPGGTLLETIPLNNLIPPSGLTGAGANPSPNPYSVGIDPFTHRALVAFASTNAGFVVNLDQSQSPSICLPGFAPSDGTSYCPVAYVDLNTGSNPQIAFEPGAHLAYVTPGGVGGTLTAVNLSNPAQAPLKILSATRTANVVTVTMEPNTPHNLVPGSTATVLISGLPLGSGLPPTNAHTSFDGAFPLLSVINNLEFTYVQTGDNDMTASTAGQQGFLSAGNNALTFSVTPSIQGIDINPITHSAVLADPNASGSQITFLDSLDENVTSLNLCIGRNLAILTNPLPCGPELGATAVAFQPFTNTVVSLNSSLNQLSLLDPSADQRVTIVQTGQMAASSICFPASSCATTPPGAGAITVSLNGAIAVDPLLNLALAVNSGSGNITPLYLGTIKPLQIESVSTPPVDAADSTVVTPAIIAQSVLIKSTALPQSIKGIQIFGTGFSGSSQVRLDGVALPATDVFFSSAQPNELDVTVPATNGSQNILTGPRNFGLDVANPDGSSSNVMDFRVVEAIPILPIAPCTAVKAAPGAVAIADDLVGTTKNYAVVTETACSSVARISLNPGSTFGSVTTIATGGTPTGVATIPRFGYAVVSNNADGTVSILDLTKNAQVVANVTVGLNPTGVAIEQETGLAVIANTGSNTATVIDLTPLQATTPGTLLPLTVATDQEPIAVAIDPDRGTNATGLAVVTSLNISANPAQGALDSVDISLAVPTKNALATASVGSIPTGIIFDPASNPRLFYAVESDSNAFVSFNPDTGSASSIPVGINPTSIAYNFQTSTILTVNSASNTVSVVDAQTFQTKATLGIGGVSFFSAAIEPFLNLAVIADQSNDRVLLFPLPH